MKTESDKQDQRSLYREAFFKERRYTDDSIGKYVLKDRRFNLEWAGAWSGRNLFAGHGKTALDAGCAVGWASFFLRDLGYRTTALDFSDYALEMARAAAQSKAITDISWMVASLDTDPIPGCYDLIICWDVIEHVQNPQAVLDKLYHALRPEGLMILTTPNRLGLPHLLLDRDPTHIHVHSPFYWTKRLRRLPSAKWICRSMMFWDHVIPWLRGSKRVIVHWLPVFGFRIRMAVLKTS